MAAPKTFDFDPSVLDPQIAKHISTFYAAVDNESTLPDWANHFTEDAKFKKGAVRLVGRQNLLTQTSKSWALLDARDHTIYSVYAFGKARDEVMLHGRSNNTWKTGGKTTFTWAARLKFERQDGKVLISEYTIIVACLSAL
ncbi:hypothetical protein DL98DRAFT_536155 [Cadophora sp. DSE1049]|nr:hypothetical protein DL98DRAFT_536155 [Cadophora sp. DSE1049]